MRTIIVCTLLFCLIICLGCSGDLSRSNAKEAIQAELDKKGFSFYYNKGLENWVGLGRDGSYFFFIQDVGTKWNETCLRQKGYIGETIKRSSGVQAKSQKDISKYCSNKRCLWFFACKKPQDIKITGIHRASDKVTHVEAQYSQTINELGECILQPFSGGQPIDLCKARKKKFKFLKYDDGWRLQR